MKVSFFFLQKQSSFKISEFFYSLDLLQIDKYNKPDSYNQF